MKDLGAKVEDVEIKMFITLRNQYELDEQNQMEQLGASKAMIDEIVATILSNGIEQPIPIIELAVKKCNLNVEDAFLMLIEEEKVNDL